MKVIECAATQCLMQFLHQLAVAYSNLTKLFSRNKGRIVLAVQVTHDHLNAFYLKNKSVCWINELLVQTKVCLR